jgi:hypothetical protein
MSFRDHEPITLEEFNGLWAQEDIESTPLDHFSECQNIKFVGPRAFGTRDGIDRHQNIGSPLSSVLRMYNYPTSDKQTLLVLVANGANGEIYHVVDSTTMFGPILTIAGMTDFGFVPYNGRAYITPFFTELIAGLNRERGMQNEFLYVYKGDGTTARKAAGNKPTTNITVANGAAGFTDAGVHIFGYVYETDTGYLTAPGGLVAHTTTALQEVDFTNVANSPDAFVVKKHIVASKVIQNYNGDVNGYQLFFIPGATIPNNVTTNLDNISFFDQDLLLDASHLLDNFAEIKAGVNLCLYHNRLCLCTEYDNISIVRVSSVGEPEAINQINGFCLVPPNGNPVTNIAELRDVLYAFQRNKTVGFVDNGSFPASWPLTAVDNAMGCGVHGIATVIDSGSSNVDYLMVCTYTGIALFNGRYILPELTWKIWEVWLNQTFKTDNRRIQIVNDSTNQFLYCVTTDRQILHADYANGLDPKKIRWSPFTFDALVNTVALINVNELLIGCDQV